MGILTEARAKSIKPGDGRITDGTVPGLYLESTNRKGRGNWLFRFTSPATKKRRDMSLGPYPYVSIANARDQANEARTMMSNGLDPIEERNALEQVKKARDRLPDFEQAARLVIDRESGRWRSEKSRKQWESSLETYVFPVIGTKAVDQLSQDDFAAVLKPIWREKSETADRVLQRCTKIMKWCVSKGYVDSNPLEVIREILPNKPSTKSKQQHHPALPWKDTPDFVNNVLRDGTKGTCREILEFIILSGVRSGEARKMTWDQVDLVNRIWTIPPENTKTAREHRVPLTVRIIEILESQKGKHSKLVFPSPSGRVLSDATLTKFLKDHKVNSDTQGRFATVHGFRSTIRTWGAENGVPEHVMEEILGHVERNKVVSAYKRTDLIEKRREVMLEWEDFL